MTLEEQVEDIHARLETEIYVNTVLQEKLKKVRQFTERHMEKEGAGEMSPWAGNSILGIIDG